MCSSDLYFGGAKTAHCATLLSFARKHGLFHAADFRPGDLAIFDWSGKKQNAQHIGIVFCVTDTSVMTVEGNTAVGNESNGGQVMERVRPVSSVIGVYRPEYGEEDDLDIDAIRKELTSIDGTGAAHSDWSAEAVGELTGMGVFNGDGAGNFGWDRPVTREALAQILYNLLSVLKDKEK